MQWRFIHFTLSIDVSTGRNQDFCSSIVGLPQKEMQRGVATGGATFQMNLLFWIGRKHNLCYQLKQPM